MSASITWYATRGAGIASLLMLTAVVVLGLLVALRWQRPGWPRFLTVQVHRSVSLLAVVFLTIHVVTAVIDPYTALGPIAALVPFASTYRPPWVGLGVVGLDLIVALVATSLIRAWLGYRAWRAVHWLAYAAWPLAILHGIGSGSDTSAPWAWAVYATCIAAVAGLIVARVHAADERESARPAPAGGMAARDTLQLPTYP